MEGVVNVLKPPGMTSSDVVVELRRIFETKKVGHTGTLDPGAAGVLPVCIGRATKLFDYLVSEKKSYIGEIFFGKTTDTQDSYGSVTAEYDCHVSEMQVKEAVHRFIGSYQQKVPMYSAVKHNGKKLYELARQNINIESKVREVDIYEISILNQTAQNRFLLKVVCSKGTYIRTLMEDIGSSLNVHAHLSFLLRTDTGKFSIENSITLHELLKLKAIGLLNHAVTPIDRAVSYLPAVQVSEQDENQKRLLYNGAKIQLSIIGMNYGENASVRVYDEHFIGIGIVEDGFLRLTLNLRELDND